MLYRLLLLENVGDCGVIYKDTIEDNRSKITYVRCFIMCDRQEMDSVLAEGKRIMNERPELRQMSIDAVLDELNDGTQEMIHNRWGVVAWMIVDPISDASINVIVKYLVPKSSGSLTDQYVGYLLQNQYHINLVQLILEAEKCGYYEKIVYYVLKNLQYQEKYESNYLLPILKMLEHHYNHNTYSEFLRYYSRHISSCNAFKIIADTIGELKTQVQYDLMCQLKRLWYQEEASQANKQLSFYVNQQGIWNKRIAIEFISESLYHDISVFEHYFHKLKMMSCENPDLWDQMIPMFTAYVRLKENEEPFGEIIGQVLQELKKIPDDTEKAKYIFIESCLSYEKIPEYLKIIYQGIISKPFEDKHIPYSLIDHYYCEKIAGGEINQSLQELQTIFRVNGICAGYSSFFNEFGSTVSELVKVSADMTGYALNCMISNNPDQIFFGMGLFLKIGNLQKYLSRLETEKTFLSDIQLVRLIKGLLYYTLDSKMIGRTVFQLLELSKDNCIDYFQFCMDEVYENYPATLYEISSKYITVDNEKQNHLAKMIKKKYEQLYAEQEKVRAVKDLQPAHEHQIIFRKAQMIQNREINKKANERSFIWKFFPKKIMKYGVRNAYIVTLSKNKKQFKESGYQHFTHEMELPMVYVHNPVEFNYKRMKYIEEVKNNASDH